MLRLQSVRNALTWLLLAVFATSPLLAKELSAEFANPPASARPWVYWFWSDGNLSREGITADLEAMQRAGVGGVLIMEVDFRLPPGPVRFGSPAWRELFKHVVAEAQRLGLEVNMNNDAGWCGSGGPWITPEHAMQKVVWSEKETGGPERFKGWLAQPPTTAGYYRDIAVLAVPTPPADGSPEKRVRIGELDAKTGVVSQQVKTSAKYGDAPANAVVAATRTIDLTDRMRADGQLEWHVPEGKWTILRIGYTPTGAVNVPAPSDAQGFDCDKLSAAAMDAHFAGLMAKLIADVGPAAGKTLSHVHIDSWETFSQNWTPRMREEFRKRRGYDLLPYLPVFTGRVVDSLEVSERFLWDLRKTIAELTNENYAGRMRALASQHGLRLSIEAYGNGLLDEMTYAAQADRPMAEFWIGGHVMETIRAMTSAAHIYGKPVCGAEAFTAIPKGDRWTMHPYAMKALGDFAFCEGINQFVFHRYSHQPWLNCQPGMGMGPFGVHYERTQTWWAQSGPWHEYLARCSHLLRQGLFVADICYLQTENAPNGLAYSPATAYQFDGCSPDVVMTRMEVKDGRLVLPDGMSYRLLVLPPSETMTPTLLGKIAQLVEAGATVVGAPPAKSPSLQDYPQCDADLRRLVQQVWGDADGKNSTEHRVGKGRVVWGQKPEEILAKMGVLPDFQCETLPGGDTVRYIHRAVDGTDVYFVASASRQPIEATCRFRVHGKQPELWYPDTGRIEPVAVFESSDGNTRIPLRFEPCGSVFVVFRPMGGKPVDGAVTLARDGKQILGVDRPVGQVAVQKAIYGRSEYDYNTSRGSVITRDVTALVQKRVAQGVRTLRPSSFSEGEVPFGVLHTLTVEYTVDGQSCVAEATEPETVALVAPADASTRLHRDVAGRLSMETTKPGNYTVKTASGKTLSATASPSPQPIDLGHAWQIEFQMAKGQPAKKLTADTLFPWNQHADADVRHFSGTATYRKELAIPADLLPQDQRVYLDLGRVEVMAQVKLNGRDLGILWKPPFRIDVTDALRQGSNVLEIQVTNLWPNRLIGDEQLPEDSKRLAKGNIAEWPEWLLTGKSSPAGRQTFVSWRLWNKEAPLLDSGLLGPVRLTATRFVLFKAKAQ